MANPALNEQAFQTENPTYIDQANAMTLNGTALKGIFLLAIVLFGGYISWSKFLIGDMNFVNAMMTVGIIVGFILAMIIIFFKKSAPFLAPLYAFAEGLALGGISAVANASYPGVVFQAFIGTFAVMFTMLALFMGRVIKVTDKFRAVLLISTGAIALTYLVAFILSFFKINVPYLFDSSPIGIGISVVVIIVAALNLLLDYDIIEKGVASYAPKYFEWYCAFGLLVTLVWLYIEILRLLSKTRNNN